MSELQLRQALGKRYCELRYLEKLHRMTEKIDIENHVSHVILT